MPHKVLETYAKQSGKTLKQAEECWEKAKVVADKRFEEKKGPYWAFVNSSTRKCLGLKDEDKEEKKPKMTEWK